MSRHPPVAAAPTLHGKMAATTAVWMTDQGREAEAAGEREERGRVLLTPTEEEWGWGTGARKGDRKILASNQTEPLEESK